MRPAKVPIWFHATVIAAVALCGCSSRPASQEAATRTAASTIATVVVANTVRGGAAATLGPVRRAMVDGTVLAFRTAGSGPDLFMLPAQGMGMDSWGTTFPLELARHFTVFLVDPPGIGYSGVPSDRSQLSVSGQARLLLDLAAGLDLPKVDVLGWGMGAQVALAMAETAPPEVDKLVLLDSAAGGPGAKLSPPAALLTSPTATQAQIQSAMFVSQQAAQRYSSEVASLGLEPAPFDVLAEYARSEQEVMGSTTLYDGLARLAAPCLIIYGAADQFYAPQDSEALAALIPYTTKVMRPYGFAEWFEDMEFVSSQIEEFLTPPGSP
jgi:proline iminopeptidase